jgi:DNA-binding GntR family transcriptional regulator
MPQPKSVKTGGESLSESAYRELQEMIVDGRLAPGSRIIETDLVDRLGVSRTSVRSALDRLHQEGIVSRQEGGRVRWFVSPLTIPDVREISEIMSALEGIAGRRVAELSRDERKKVVSRLREINEELHRAVKERPPDSARAAELDVAFHRGYVEAAGRPRLVGFCESLEAQVQRYTRSYMAYLAPIASSSVDEHKAIISAIERGNADAVEIAIQSNWLQAADRYVSVIETVGERGNW